MPIRPEEFGDVLDRVVEFLQQEERVSYRGLKRQFELSDEDLEDIKEELIYARRVAFDEEGRVLVWDAERRAADYTPRHLADKILNIRSAIEGEKKQVTVLFCDVVNSMTLADRLGAENWHETLNEFFAILTSAVHNLEGTINQFTGDGVMALFGAPLAAEDHALRACMAALKICEETQALSQGVEEKYGLPFGVRVGLNSGEVVVGSIGDDLRMDYTAQGQVVGIAARLEGMADANAVLISEFTRRLVEGISDVESIGARQIKGVARPLEVFRLQAVQVSRSRFDVSLQRGLSRFVGRDDDMAQLRAALHQAEEGQGQVVGVVAEAGTGKSRLCHEFLQECRDRGMTVLQGHAVPHGRNLPYLPLLQVFRGFYDISEQDDSNTSRQKIRERLLSVDPELEPVLPVVYEFMGCADPDAPPLRMDPDAKQRQLFALLRRFVQGGDGSEARVVTCIEDLHWLDPASTLFLEQWVEAIAGSSSILLTSFRPEYRADWMHSSYYRQLPLAPLEAGAVKELLLDLLGDHPSTAGLADEIYQRTGGNPFFCEEIVQSLRESGDLSEAPMRYQLNRPLTEIDMPVSVQSVLAARIDRLRDEDKAVLQLAAVIGRKFPFDLLRHASGKPDAELMRSLATLKQNEFLYERIRGISFEYVFKHALTHEVALKSQLQEKRKLSNASVAEGIEQLYPDRADEMAAMAAFHWEHADQPEQAARAYVRAAEYSGKGNRLQEMTYMRKALNLTDALPMSPARHEIRLQALVKLITGGVWRFEMSKEELDAMVQEALAIANGAGLTDVAFLIRGATTALIGMMHGDVRRWGPEIDKVLEDMEGVSPEVEAALRANHANSLWPRGRFEEGLASAEAVREMTGGDPAYGMVSTYSVLVLCHNLILRHATALGQLDYALQTGVEGIAIAKSAGLTEELIWNLGNTPKPVYLMGLPAEDPQVQQVCAYAMEAYELGERAASDFTRGVAKRARGLSLLLIGEHDEAEAAMQECIDHCVERRAHLEEHAHTLSLLSDIRLAKGDVDGAVSAARAAITSGDERGTPYLECLGCLALARALMEQQDSNLEIADLLGTAQKKVDETGGRSLQGQIFELQSGLAERAGDTDLAHRQLAQALESYTDMGARGHVARLTAALA